MSGADKGFSESNQKIPDSIAVPKTVEMMYPSKISKTSSVVLGFILGSIQICEKSIICRPTACVTGAEADADSAWEQDKLEAREMLENAAESHSSGERYVSPLFDLQDFLLFQLLFVHSYEIYYRECLY